MLSIKKRRRVLRTLVVSMAVLMLGGGLYILCLVLTPVVAPIIAMKPIDIRTLPSPTENRIIIPKIGVNIHYDTGVTALDRGAEWRYPERGNPEKGGNFIIAGHRFSIQPTPGGTLEKSPFMNINKLAIGDQIIVDYTHQRYGYEITTITDVKPDQTEIEAPSTIAKLTLYSCELGGAEDGRIVVVAKPLGLANQ